MNCSTCGKNEAIEESCGPALCDDCFVPFFEKRIRRTIRRHELLGPKDKTLVPLGGDSASMVLLSLMQLLSAKAPRSELIAIIPEGVPKEVLDYCDYLGVKRMDSSESALAGAERLGATKIALSDTLDSLVLSGLALFLKGTLKESPIIIRPLAETPQKDVLRYAKLKKIPFTKNAEKPSALAKSLERLEGRYPGTRYQLLTSLDDLRAMAT